MRVFLAIMCLSLSACGSSSDDSTLMQDLSDGEYRGELACRWESDAPSNETCSALAARYVSTSAVVVRKSSPLVTAESGERAVRLEMQRLGDGVFDVMSKVDVEAWAFEESFGGGDPVFAADSNWSVSRTVVVRAENESQMNVSTELELSARSGRAAFNCRCLEKGAIDLAQNSK